MPNENKLIFLIKTRIFKFSRAEVDNLFKINTAPDQTF